MWWLVLVLIVVAVVYLKTQIDRVTLLSHKLDTFFEQTIKPELAARLEREKQLSTHLQTFTAAVTKITHEVEVFTALKQNLGDLSNLLKPQQFRGPLGKMIVRDLIRDKLPPGSYEEEHPFRDGTRVDFVIRLNEKLVPVDAKFPVENYTRVREATTEPEQRRYRMEFKRDVKRHVDEIQRYIKPDENTYPFAIMVIPSEGVYYEAIIRDEDFTDESGIYRYATGRNVVAASPYTFWAFLTVIEQGLKGFEISKQAEKILQTMQAMAVDLTQFSQGEFRLVGEHLKHAMKNFEAAQASLEDLLDRVQSGGTGVSSLQTQEVA